MGYVPPPAPIQFGDGQRYEPVSRPNWNVQTMSDAIDRAVIAGSRPSLELERQRRAQHTRPMLYAFWPIVGLIAWGLFWWAYAAGAQSLH